jgi:hypothetical protein
MAPGESRGHVRFELSEAIPLLERTPGALGDPIDGAVFLFQGADAEAAERFALDDPYVVNGVVTRWRVRPWLTVVGSAAAAPLGRPGG